jgi:HK97 family phage prohead protease
MDTRMKIGDTSTGGFIQGYAAIWDVKDLDSDRIRKGAFARAISNQISQGKVPFMARHFADGGDTTEAIGQIVEAREDDVGFWIKAKLFNTATAQNIRVGVREAAAMYGMSVGWRNVDGGFKELPEGGGYEFTEMNLKEVTITLRPAQEDTVGLMQAKNDRIARLEQAIAELQERVGSGVAPVDSDNPAEGDGEDHHPKAAKSLDDGEARRRKMILARLRR